MNSSESQKTDPLIDEVREVRQHLVGQHGGLKGWVKHLQELQRQNPPKKTFRPKSTAR
jgi:hypothetical protein